MAFGSGFEVNIAALELLVYSYSDIIKVDRTNELFVKYEIWTRFLHYCVFFRSYDDGVLCISS
jgi:hypothetical protein